MFFRAPGTTANPILIYLHGLPGFTGDLDLPQPLVPGETPPRLSNLFAIPPMSAHTRSIRAASFWLATAPEA
jgi:hypothetical protein